METASVADARTGASAPQLPPHSSLGEDVIEMMLQVNDVVAGEEL